MGPLRRVYRPRPSAYEKYGFTSQAERFGEHEGSDVLYFGVQSFNQRELAVNVGISLIRKIMKREGFEYTHPDCMLLPTFGNMATGPVSIQFFSRTIGTATPPVEDQVQSSWTFTIYDPNVGGQPKTVRTFGEEFYENVMKGPWFGGDAQTPNRQIFGYRCVYLDYTNYAQDPNGQPIGRIGCLHSLEKQYMKTYCFTKVKVQNVTHADAGTAVHDRNNITANPVVGKLFRFKDRYPVLYSYQGNEHGLGTTGASAVPGAAVNVSTVWRIQHDINNDGIIMYDNGPGVGMDGWDRLPRATQFQNCVAIQSVYMRPGGMTEFVLKFKFDGLLSKFIRGFCTGVTGKSYALDEAAYGTCVLLALEKSMPDTVGFPIIHYSVDRTYGSIFGKRLAAIMPKWNQSSAQAQADDAA